MVGMRKIRLRKTKLAHCSTVVRHHSQGNHQRAVTGLGEKSRDTRHARPQFFREGALRGELQLKLAGQVLAFELFVLTHIGRNHFADLTVISNNAGVDGFGLG